MTVTVTVPVPPARAPGRSDHYSDVTQCVPQAMSLRDHDSDRDGPSVTVVAMPGMACHWQWPCRPRPAARRGSHDGAPPVPLTVTRDAGPGVTRRGRGPGSSRRRGRQP